MCGLFKILLLSIAHYRHSNLIIDINIPLEMVRYSKQEEVGHCHLEYID